MQFQVVRVFLAESVLHLVIPTTKMDNMAHGLVVSGPTDEATAIDRAHRTSVTYSRNAKLQEQSERTTISIPGVGTVTAVSAAR